MSFSARITVVVGLPGSGKTTFMRVQASTAGACEFDDFHGFSRDDLALLSHSRHLAGLDAAIGQGRHCYLSDIAFCLRERRERTVADLAGRYPGVPMEFRFYANEPVQCRLNLGDDPLANAERLRMIGELTARYDIPAGHDVVRVAVRIPAGA